MKTSFTIRKVNRWYLTIIVGLCICLYKYHSLWSCYSAPGPQHLPSILSTVYRPCIGQQGFSNAVSLWEGLVGKLPTEWNGQQLMRGTSRGRWAIHSWEGTWLIEDQYAYIYKSVLVTVENTKFINVPASICLSFNWC